MKQSLKTRVITGAIFVPIVLAFLIPGRWVPFIPLLFFLVAAYVSALEKGRAVDRRMRGMAIVETATLTVLPVILMILRVPKGWFVKGIPVEAWPIATSVVAPRLISTYALAACAIFGAWFLFRVWRKGAETLPYAVGENLIALSTGVPVAAMFALLYGVAHGFFWVLLAVLTPWISDTFSYFIGTFFGSRPFARRLSPKKTVEGTAGGILGTLILYMIYIPTALGPKLDLGTGSAFAVAILFAVVMSFVSTCGDLAASALKRWCKVKDFGRLLPGHGGVSDRLDSLAWSLPAMLMLAMLVDRLA